MTILLGKGNQVYYYFGQLMPETISQDFKSTTFKGIRELILQKKNSTNIDDLMYIIKSDDKSTFKKYLSIKQLTNFIITFQTKTKINAIFFFFFVAVYCS